MYDHAPRITELGNKLSNKVLKTSDICKYAEERLEILKEIENFSDTFKSSDLTNDINNKQ